MDVNEAKVNEVWDKFFKSLPWGSLMVFGEGLLRTFVPHWDEIKKDILYFVAYAETVGKTENVKGDVKKKNVVNLVWNAIDDLLPHWLPATFWKGIIGSLIDLLVHYLNDHVPNWETEVMNIFKMAQTPSVPQQTPATPQQ